MSACEFRVNRRAERRTASWLRAGRWSGLLIVLPILAATAGRAAEPAADPFAAVRQEFSTKTVATLKQYCVVCHSTDEQQGELDLERFTTLDQVRRDTKVWLKVAEMLDNGEMPPKDFPKPPSANERKQLRAWVQRYLDAEAIASAGDPGPVVLRRLSNAEYTYSVRDLTGVDLNPAREFPADSAAGEGFTNAGGAMVMSPALLVKYLDSGKAIAQHAVLLPDGIRFSPSTTRSDWTNDVLDRIRGFYREFSATSGGTQVNLQGIVFDTNSGGRLPVERYLEACLVERDALRSGTKSVVDVARQRQLNAKYLGILWRTLNDQQPSLLLDNVRKAWREAKPADAQALAQEIGRWQQNLWRFTSVGHIGKVGGPKAWQEPVTPITNRQELRVKLPTVTDRPDVTIYLVTGDAGDGNEGDFVVWERPRLVAPGRPEFPLRDLRQFARDMSVRRAQLFAQTARALDAAAAASRSTTAVNIADLAARHQVDPPALSAWLNYLGIGSDASIPLDLLREKIDSASNYAFVKGWGSHNTPLLVANSSDQHVRIPGNMKPHGVCVHPSPTLAIAVGWRSPLAGQVRIEGKVTHAHPECGNGVTWSVELRRGSTRQRLATGVAQGNQAATIGPIEMLSVQPGDLVSLVVGPRDGNHSCDLTDLEFVLKTAGQDPREWNLTRDVSSDIQAGNPHADRYDHKAVWHFYTEPVKAGDQGTVIPAGSLLAQWQAADQAQERARLAAAIEKLLLTGPGPSPDEKNPDVILYRQLSSLAGPLLAGQLANPGNKAEPAIPAKDSKSADADPRRAAADGYGLDPAQFGRHPSGAALDAQSLCVRAPNVIEVRLPADLAAGAEFVTSATLHAETGAEGSVQCQVLDAKPQVPAALVPPAAVATQGNGPWTSNNRGISYAVPMIVRDGGNARRRLEQAFDAFRSVFPIALCYTKIVPVDEVVTLTLFYREDDHLRRLMLDDAQAARLDRLWDELHFVSYDALTLVDAYAQLMEYATQDADPKVFEPLRKPINDRAAAFRQLLVETEPKHVAAVLDFAARAYRRPLTAQETDELQTLYRTLRQRELPHDEAIQFLLARVLVAPAFLYRLEKSAPAAAADRPADGDRTYRAHPVSDWELATRLSYFLWSSIPDEQLRAVAASGRLRDREVLSGEVRRMLRDPRVRRLSTEFACQWLHIYDFATLDEKSEKHFPEFVGLRDDMYEEAIRFFTDAFQQNGSVLGFLDADHTFVNDRLARFYGLAAAPPAGEWQRVDQLRQQGRGGVLGMAATLAKQSGASRTSPILRGNWVSEVLLGEKLPKPPKDVPRLPEDETQTDGLTVRQLIERHSIDERCSNCHQRIDPFGFALEGFDAIGRRRDKDLANRPIDTRTKLLDGTELAGLEGLRDYLAKTRRDAVLRQFCRKLLGYSLGRSIQLSDEPLLAQMQRTLAENDYRFGAIVEAIAASPQFQTVRESE